ncbi:HAD family hydrolase [Corynebacterium sp. 153RC1]|uniref:heavy metal translocating P-type ATPase n=1 Tax=unclassified Corynebacterium TaxID=2624378 RepID=UPI00211CD385|nr:MULTISPECIES: HAD family hydrolase [unclassified Corynebacterium]MCQ9370521.1 HAD family hydrolase [Corynebacterium sp. 35RC1]MCQ9351780.1 HAD family hydrolase [Corynebacterium sp. 209RC1]MCQ9354516.1 HAD family hydrolase [Corynebacterium sp. 1222RC1]MCQ9356062.1 HAD family hydrolase [Corynebacterium sp. 122RC1]MCQ9358694.1 HAD family hydrolase [Corynebacterium sp. 142RC1]
MNHGAEHSRDGGEAQPQQDTAQATANTSTATNTAAGADAAVETAIEQAKTAAARAGVDTGTFLAQTAGGAKHGATSWSFRLGELQSAASIGEIEAALEEIEGVRAKIVYETHMAWVTAPGKVDPRDLIAVFDAAGVTAQLSESSLQRRMAWADVEEGRHTRALRRHRRRNAAKALAEQVQRHAPAAVSEAEVSNVLFTARALVTKRRLWVSAVFTLPVLLISFYQQLQFDYWQWVLMVLSMPVVFYGAWPFHRACIAGWRRGMSALDAPSSLAIMSAWLWTVVMMLFTAIGEPTYRANPLWTTIDPTRFAGGVLFFDVACGMTLILLAGRLFVRKSRVSLVEQFRRFRPDPATEVEVVRKNRKTGEITHTHTKLQKLNVGDDVLVPAGSIVPVDGRVIGGASTLKAGLIGIPKYEAKVGSTVLAGSLNQTAQLKVRVEHTGHRTWVAAVLHWVISSQHFQTQAEGIATRAASNLVPISLTVAGVNFALWALVTNNLNQAFATTLAVLGAVAPLSIAVSATIAVRQGIEGAARAGVLIRDGAALKALSRADTVIFNRVGALSDGEMHVESITAARGENPDMVIRVAAALAMESDHPVSRALVRAARESRDAVHDPNIPTWLEASHLEIDDEGDFHATITIDERPTEAILWRPKNLSDLTGRLAAAAVAGGSPLVVRWKGVDRGVVTLHDDPKPDALEAVDALEGLGVETMMLSRDTYPVARRYGDSVGVSHVLAGVQPASKAQTVRGVRAHGAQVAMVGDTSVNACFQVANVGILSGALKQVKNPSEMEQLAADVVILGSEVTPIPKLVRFARRLQRLVKINLLTAWVYHIVVLVLAVAGVLHPMLATVCMLGITLAIEFRSQRARALLA